MKAATENADKEKTYALIQRLQGELQGGGRLELVEQVLRVLDQIRAGKSTEIALLGCWKLRKFHNLLSKSVTEVSVEIWPS